jgi:hypothetical protein
MHKGFSGGQRGRLLPKHPICPLKLCMCPAFMRLIENLGQIYSSIVVAEEAMLE